MDKVHSPRPGWRAFLLSWAFLAILTTAWAVATPLGASPDEPAHIIKAAAVARGELIGAPTSNPAEMRVRVPVGIADAATWPCYAFHPKTGAACLGGVQNGSELAAATTSAGLYNPVYYAVVGWPSLITSNTTAMVLGMRVVSALLCTAFLALAFVVLMRLTGRAILAIAFLGAATPMLFFLASAVNPNALEVVAGVTLLVLLLAIVKDRATPSKTMLVGVAASGIALATARGLSPLWMALIAVIVLVYARPARLVQLISLWSVRVAIIVLALGVVFAGAWIVYTGTLSSLGTFPGAGKTSAPQAFVTMLTRAFDPGLIGYFGWLDTPAPAYVLALWSAIAIGVTVVAVAVARSRETWAMLIAVAGVLLVPAVVQALSVARSGYIWQGRYTLIAFSCLIVLAGVVLGERFALRRDAHRLFILIAVLVGLGQVLAFAVTLKRYAVGGNPSLVAPYLHADWSPAGGTILWVAISAIGIAGFAVIAWRLVRQEGQGGDGKTELRPTRAVSS